MLLFLFLFLFPIENICLFFTFTLSSSNIMQIFGVIFIKFDWLWGDRTYVCEPARLNMCMCVTRISHKNAQFIWKVRFAISRHGGRSTHATIEWLIFTFDEEQIVSNQFHCWNLTKKSHYFSCGKQRQRFNNYSDYFGN